MKALLTGLMAATLSASFTIASAHAVPVYAPQAAHAGTIHTVDYDQGSSRSHWRHDRHWGWDNGRHEGWKKRHWRRHHDDYSYSERRAFRRHHHGRYWRHGGWHDDNGVTLHFSF
jgi:hypothetical protein